MNEETTWRPIETAPVGELQGERTPLWLYVPGYKARPTLPENSAFVKAHYRNGVWVSVKSAYALVKQHAPTHWAHYKPLETPDAQAELLAGAEGTGGNADERP